GRWHIEVGEETKAKIYQTYIGPNFTGDFLYNSVTTLRCGERAEVDLYCHQSLPGQVFFLHEINAQVGRLAALNLWQDDVGGKLTWHNVSVVLVAADSRCDLPGSALLDD